MIFSDFFFIVFFCDNDFDKLFENADALYCTVVTV